MQRQEEEEETRKRQEEEEAERVRKEEEERLARKKRLEEIMARTRGGTKNTPAKKPEPAAAEPAATNANGKPLSEATSNGHEGSNSGAAVNGMTQLDNFVNDAAHHFADRLVRETVGLPKQVDLGIRLAFGRGRQRPLATQ